MSTAPDARFEAWLDQDSLGRCPATRTFDDANTMITVRCDGQAGHGGDHHQGSTDNQPVTWPFDQPAEDRPA